MLQVRDLPLAMHQDHGESLGPTAAAFIAISQISGRGKGQVRAAWLHVKDVSTRRQVPHPDRVLVHGAIVES